MPTIKKTGIGSELRIITKVVNAERRVSCSCCEVVECCMYPADQLGIGYLQADLPDEVIVEFPNQSPSTWSRSGSYFVSGNLSLRPVGARWALFNNEDEVGDRGVQCLIEPELLAPRVTDNFADTYNISYSDPAIASTTVTRESLCVWRGQTTVTILGNSTPLTVVLEYFNNPLGGGQEDRLKWIVNGDIKIGTQNTPVGSYQSGDATWTVS